MDNLNGNLTLFKILVISMIELDIRITITAGVRSPPKSIGAHVPFASVVPTPLQVVWIVWPAVMGILINVLQIGLVFHLPII